MEPTKKAAPKPIPLTPCRSGVVDAYGYDAETRTLAVKFRSGDEFRYLNVPHETFDKLKSCESIGKFLWAEIRGKFENQRMTPGGLGRVAEHERAA